jgi:hypothetical protein
MRKIILIFLCAILLSSCNGWVLQPLPYTPPTPFMPFTPTPSVLTGTPVVIGANTSTPSIATATGSTTPFPTFTLTNTPGGFTETPTITVTVQPGAAAISIKVLGCNTSIDITHGMGEVTNAFVTLKNTGGVELTNIKATLFALDEDRVHPDKTVELTSLPIGHQVTIKLTVDSRYQEETPIQVEVNSDQGLFPREGLASCRDIGLLAPNPSGLNTPVPATP